jgi:transcriptional regulator with XRE-family HTH domain
MRKFNQPHPLTLYREREGLTKRQLAQRLRVAPMSITRYEAGERQIARNLIYRFAAITGIPEVVLAGYADWVQDSAAE